MSKPMLFSLLALIAAVAYQVWILDIDLSTSVVIRSLIAVAGGFLIFRTGFRILGGFSQPIAPPPEPGELRKVKIVYRCDICGTEVRMTLANDQIPEAPRHCLEDMVLTAPIED